MFAVFNDGFLTKTIHIHVPFIALVAFFGAQVGHSTIGIRGLGNAMFVVCAQNVFSFTNFTFKSASTNVNCSVVLTVLNVVGILNEILYVVIGGVITH